MSPPRVELGAGVVSHSHVLQLALEAGARPAALEVYGGEVLWADAADGSVRACDKERCAPATARLLRNNTGAYLHDHIHI